VLVPKDPRLSLSELKSLIRRCDLLVVNDTGPRHIGKAFGVPVVTIFGPTHQAWTDTDYALERKIQIPVDCGPCQKKVCPFEHHDCMAGVSVDMVYAQCSALLRLRAAAV
jgi:heptosyltransferase-2